MTSTTNIKDFLSAPYKYTHLKPYKSIDAEDLPKLCAILKGNYITLTNLDLSCRVEGDIATAIAQMLKSNTTLTQLSLSYNQIGDEGAAAIGQGLKGNTALTYLGLNHNQIGDEGAAAIGQGLKGNTALTYLGLENNQIGDAGAVGLGEGLKGNTTLTAIGLGYNKIRDAGAVGLAEWLKSNTTLTQLSLSYNQIGDAGAAAIIEGLSSTKLTSLQLAYNQIGDEGAAVIVQWLESNTTLVGLCLNNNQIGDAVIAGFKKSPCLYIDAQNPTQANTIEQFLAAPNNYKSLSINVWNNFRNEGFTALATGLKSNTALTYFHFHNHQMGDEEIRVLVDVLKENKTVKSINLSFNTIGSEGAKALAEMLRTNNTVMSINLRSNKIGLEGAKALAEMLKENKTIKSIDLTKNKLGNDILNEIEKKLETNKKVIAQEVQEDDHIVIEKLIKIFPVKDGLHVDASEEILKMNDLIREGNHRLQGESQQGILLLGKTGSGKSTLAHLLAGKSLQAILDDETGMLVIDAMQPLQEIIISHNKVSETKIPNKCQLDNLVIWDCPGFKDTDVAQEIANAFYIKKLCETTKQLKFVLVVSDSVISENRGTYFIEIVNQMVKSFNDIEALNCSVSLVVTHATNSKQIQHIQNSINRITTQNEHIEPATQQMIAFLSKSVHLFHTPIDEGRVVSKTDILAAINSSTEYCDNNAILANMSVSKEAIAHGENLLQMVSHNFNKILEVIVSAIAEPNGAKNLFIQKHELIKNWVPSSMQYDSARWNTTDNYFRDLEQLQALLNIFKPKQDKVASFEEGLDLLKNALKIFEEFSLNKAGEKYIKLLQEYEYVLVQQFEYIKFFSELCQKELPTADGFTKINKYCHETLDFGLKEQIKTLKLEEEKTDPAYYNKAIKYLNMHADEPDCKTNKAKAQVKLRDIVKYNNDVKHAIENYIEAIKCNAKLPEIYNKLGALFYDQGNYHQAIECFKVTNNAFEIKICFKEWIAKDLRNPDIRMEKGDYYASIGLYGKAKESYHNACSLSEDNEFKAQGIRKIADIIKNKTDLAEYYSNMADNYSYNNFEMVDEQFIELIGQANANENNIMDEFI